MFVNISDYPDEENGLEERQVEVRIDEQDLWSLDHTLAYIIHPALVRLKEIKHGSPHTDPEDAPSHLEDVHERWDWIMDEMIFAFGTINTNWEEEFYNGATYTYDEETKRAALINPSGKGPDYEGMKKVSKRMENGFRLFGKYYTGLWD